MAGKWLLRIVTLAVWVLAALSATWWSLKFVGARPSPLAVTTLAVPAAGSDPADLAKVFGPAMAPVLEAVPSAPKAADPGTRFVLVGVVADRASAGVALIAVDGKAARPYRVGSPVEDSYTLKSVAARSAVLAPSSRTDQALMLELAPQASAAQANIPRLPSNLPVNQPVNQPASPLPNQQLPIQFPNQPLNQLLNQLPGAPPAQRPAR